MSFNALFFCRKGSGSFRGRIAAPQLMFFAFLIIIAPLVLCAAAGAAEVIYTGDGNDLQASPNWLPNRSRPAVLPTADAVFLSSDNNVTVNYDAAAVGMTNPYHVVGGLSDLEDATNNTVTFIDGKIEGFIYGGASRYGNAERNTVDISGGAIEFKVFGGYSQKGNVSYNTVAISGGAMEFDVYGGLSDIGSADYNTVTISGGTVEWSLYGGSSDTRTPNNNTVTFNSVTMDGGKVIGDVCAGLNMYGNAAYNTVIIISGEVGGDVNGAASLLPGNAIYNTVSIGGGAIGVNVFGGQSLDYGNAEYNIVGMSYGKVLGNVFGGWSEYGRATGNTVSISGGEVVGDIYGGNVDKSDDVATGNTVAISGGEIGGDVYGGFVNGNGDAINNTVTIDGSPVFSPSSYIYGGYVEGNGDNFTGNTLNVKNAGITVACVDNFEYYNFYLPQDMTANNTMLFVTDEVNLNGTTIRIYLQGDTALEEGAIVTLIDSDAKITNIRENSTSQASQGAFITYNFNIYGDEYSLRAQLFSITHDPSNKALTNSRTAPLAFINQGADLAASLEHLEVSGDSRFTAFAVMGGGSSTYDTGSDVDIDGFSMLAGVTWNAPVKKNNLALSAFIEAGWGSYDTNNDYGGKSVRGDGDTDYFGGGLHLRYKWDSDNSGGLYAEGSLRFGRATTDFNSRDLISGTGFSYDSGSNYYGVHTGLGYVWQLSGKTRLDVSGKYLWTHLESDELTASNGDRISFDSANSHRLRAGFRFYHDYGNANAVTLYYGAAYEYEFDGDADGRLYGTYALDGSSLSGGSGIGELGVTFRPSKDNDRLMMQLGVQGYVGVREGVSGMLKLQYAF